MTSHPFESKGGRDVIASLPQGTADRAGQPYPGSTPPILHTPYSILAAHRARSLRLDDALFADAGKEHTIVAVGGLEGAHEFTDAGAIL